MAHGFTDDKETADLDEYINNKISGLVGQITTLQNKITDYWKTIYPVGAIYMSTAQTNPATLFGGTWVAWGSGRVPVGINAADSDFNTVEKTGGAKTNKFGLGSGFAKVDFSSVRGDIAYKYTSRANNPWTSNWRYGVSIGEMKSSTTLNESADLGGTTDAGSVVQPYITCYMWKRTA